VLGDVNDKNHPDCQGGRSLEDFEKPPKKNAENVEKSPEDKNLAQIEEVKNPLKKKIRPKAARVDNDEDEIQVTPTRVLVNDD